MYKSNHSWPVQIQYTHLTLETGDLWHTQNLTWHIFCISIPTFGEITSYTGGYSPPRSHIRLKNTREPQRLTQPHWKLLPMLGATWLDEDAVCAVCVTGFVALFNPPQIKPTIIWTSCLFQIAAEGSFVRKQGPAVRLGLGSQTHCLLLTHSFTPDCGQPDCMGNSN